MRKEDFLVGTDCSGIEAPVQSLEKLGIPFTHVFSSANRDAARDFIRRVFNPEQILTDVRRTDDDQPPSVSLYVAGFPCQPFSTAGLRKGFDDPRGQLFDNVMDYIRIRKPVAFLLENVPGILNAQQGRAIMHVLGRLNELTEYQVAYKVLDTIRFGLPQGRKRVFFVGILLSHSMATFRFPDGLSNASTSLEDFLGQRTPNETPGVVPDDLPDIAKSRNAEAKRTLAKRRVDLTKTECALDIDGDFQNARLGINYVPTLLYKRTK